MSTCDHEAFTASFLLTSVFFTLTYWPKAKRVISNRSATITTTTISALLMRFSWKVSEALLGACRTRVQHSINCGSYLLHRRQISRKNVCHIELLAIGLAFPYVQHLQDAGSVKANLLRQRLHRLALSYRRIVTQHDKRVPEKRGERR